jgi:MFS family permease
MKPLCPAHFSVGLIGGILFGFLTDKLGRKPTFFVANILMTAGGLLAAAAPGYTSFLAARVITGFAMAGQLKNRLRRRRLLVCESRRCCLFTSGQIQIP